MTTHTSIEDIKALTQFIKTKASNDYTPLLLNCHQYEDLLNFYCYANLALQQLDTILAEDCKADLTTSKLVKNGQYYTARLEQWLPDSCYNNQAYRSYNVKLNF